MLLREEVVDPVPDGVRGAARSSLAWRDPDSALAALIADSAADEGRLVHVRGPAAGQPRLLTFATPDLTIEIEVTISASPAGNPTSSAGPAPGHPDPTTSTTPSTPDPTTTARPTAVSPADSTIESGSPDLAGPPGKTGPGTGPDTTPPASPVSSVASAGALAGQPASAGLASSTNSAGPASVGGSAGSVVLIGQLVPPGAAIVSVDHAAGAVEVAADTMGRFQVTGLRIGPLRLRCRQEGAHSVRTDWFLP